VSTGMLHEAKPLLTRGGSSGSSAPGEDSATILVHPRVLGFKRRRRGRVQGFQGGGEVSEGLCSRSRAHTHFVPFHIRLVA
jgi:hypothetical protein